MYASVCFVLLIVIAVICIYVCRKTSILVQLSCTVLVSQLVLCILLIYLFEQHYIDWFEYVGTHCRCWNFLHSLLYRTVCRQGRIQDLDFGGQASLAPSQNHNTGAEVYMGMGCGEGKAVPTFQKFWGLKMHILVHSPDRLNIWYALCLPSLTFQADCGSIKGAGVPAEDDTEHYLPWQWTDGKFNHWQRQNTELQWRLFFRWSWVWKTMALGPLWIATVCSWKNFQVVAMCIWYANRMKLLMSSSGEWTENIHQSWILI